MQREWHIRRENTSDILALYTLPINSSITFTKNSAKLFSYDIRITLKTLLH